jgi:hypothetical protein
VGAKIPYTCVYDRGTHVLHLRFSLTQMPISGTLPHSRFTLSKAWHRFDSDQPALGPDGQLLDATEIEWFNDPDDAQPISHGVRYRNIHNDIHCNCEHIPSMRAARSLNFASPSALSNSVSHRAAGASSFMTSGSLGINEGWVLRVCLSKL